MMRTGTLHVYPDLSGAWRWTLRAANGRVVADGAESYDSHANAVRAARRLAFVAATARVEP